MDMNLLAIGAIQYVALLLALSVHEFSHAALATWLGDPTAQDEGRLSVNPIVHVDPVGTVLLPLLGLFTAFPLFGWAKPVPVQPALFRRGWFGRGQVLVAAGGPISNLLQALGWVVVAGVIWWVVPGWASQEGSPAWLLYLFVRYSVLINLVLMAFNLIPVPPLDGSHVASWGLPRRWGERFDRIMEPYGFIILIALFVTGVLGFVLWPALAAGTWLLQFVGGW